MWLGSCDSPVAGSNGSDTPTVSGGIVLNVSQAESEDGSTLEIDGSLTAAHYEFSSLDITGSAEWEGDPNGPPQSSSGEFIFDVTAAYIFESIFAAQYLLAEGVLDTLGSLDTPVSFTIDGDITSIWDGETIEITFEDHHVFADGG